MIYIYMALFIKTVEKNPLIVYPSVVGIIPTYTSVYSNYNYGYINGVDTIHHIKNNYTDLDSSKQVRKQVRKYYYYKIMDKWLSSSYVDLLGFFKINDGKVQLITNINEYSKESIQSQTERQIIKHIEENVLSQNIVYEFLTKFVEKNSYKWYKLQNHEDELKEYLHSKIRKFFESLIPS